jgi:hypothetical protein
MGLGWDWNSYFNFWWGWDGIGIENFVISMLYYKVCLHLVLLCRQTINGMHLNSTVSLIRHQILFNWFENSSLFICMTYCFLISHFISLIERHVLHCASNFLDQPVSQGLEYIIKKWLHWHILLTDDTSKQKYKFIFFYWLELYLQYVCFCKILSDKFFWPKKVVLKKIYAKQGLSVGKN